MMKDKMEDALCRYLQKPAAIGEGKAEQTMALARLEMAQSRRRERLSLGGFIARQIRFVGWRIWLGQFLLVAAVLGLLRLFCGQPLLISERAGVLVLSVLSVAVFMTMLPFLYRSVRYKMVEVETATRFSLGTLCLARLMIVGLGDLALLGGLFLWARLNIGLADSSIALCLALPFLAASSGSLWLLKRYPLEQFIPINLALGAVLMASLVVLGRAGSVWPLLFCNGHGWLLGIAMAVFCIWQMKGLAVATAAVKWRR